MELLIQALGHLRVLLLLLKTGKGFPLLLYELLKVAIISSQVDQGGIVGKEKVFGGWGGDIRVQGARRRSIRLGISRTEAIVIIEL